MQVASYGGNTVSTGEVNILHDLERPIGGRHVLIVEDIVDTGLTLHKVRNMLLDRQPASLRIATLLDKPSRRSVQVPVDYVGLRHRGPLRGGVRAGPGRQAAQPALRGHLQSRLAHAAQVSSRPVLALPPAGRVRLPPPGPQTPEGPLDGQGGDGAHRQLREPHAPPRGGGDLPEGPGAPDRGGLALEAGGPGRQLPVGAPGDPGALRDQGPGAQPGHLLGQGRPPVPPPGWR